MSCRIINGKELAQELRLKIKEMVKAFTVKYGFQPSLHVVLVGDDPASEMYVNMKEKAAKEIGIKSVIHKYESIEENELLSLIEKLNTDHETNAILVQLPIPENINKNKILSAISPLKDVDGFHEKNMGLLFRGNDSLVPCTPLGIIKMLEEEHVEIAGSHAVVVGRSNLVGKPVSIMLLNKNATVTMCHSKTKNLSDHTKSADILIVAAGKPKMIKGDMVKEGVVVIDVGTSKLQGKLVGDVDFESVSKKASLITPVPGGVGPITVTMLLHNTIKAANIQKV